MDGRSSLGLLTDLYQLTMACGYWKHGISEREAVFHLFFRKHPFGGEYALACGLRPALEFLERWTFDDDDVEFLKTCRGNDGEPLFDRGFLDALRGRRFTCDVDAVPEGTAVFAHEPLLRVRGPLLECQIVETALLNAINFQTLIATQASRICAAAEGDPVLEFGLRRAQGPDGGLSASRAAYVGGCAGTSNVLAGRRFGIPVGGTHAHSWVMSFPDEREAFAAYARAMPNNCIFLVDTYDTLEGVRRAIEQARALRAEGHEMIGIRLDSGDLVRLSRDSRALLDDAGFPEAKIVASNDLDEVSIRALKAAGAAIDVWGVGTKLATAWAQPALGGVYKMSAWRDDPSQPLQPTLKLSEDPIKISTPGVLQVRRRRGADGGALGDMIWDESAPEGAGGAALGEMVGFDGKIHRFDATEGEDLLIPAVREGKITAPDPPLAQVREHAAAELAALPSSVRRGENPEAYPVGLERGLHDRKQQAVARLRGEG